MAMISERMPRKKYRDFMTALGFGQPTGISFPAEQRGHLPHTEKISAFDYATTFFGYGVSSSALTSTFDIQEKPPARTIILPATTRNQ